LQGAESNFCIWIAPNSLCIMVGTKKKPSPVDVHKPPHEASAKKSYNDHCIWIDRSMASPPTSAQDPSVHCRMAILLKQVVQEKMRQGAGRDKQEALPLV